MGWRDVICKKRELLTKATRVLVSRSRVDAVELSRELGVDVNTFVIFLADDLIEIAKSKGFKVIYGKYDPETGLIKDRVSAGEKGIIVPIFIHP